MRFIIFIALSSILFYSCNSPKTKKNLLELKSKTSENYLIEGSITNFHPNTVYLNKIIENSIYVIDSSSISNNLFQFKGSVEFPERYALTFNNFSSVVVVIIENDTIHLDLDFNNLESPNITGSALNDKMKSYSSSSKNIFKKIKYLFPKFQKARLENDAEQLKILNEEMNIIEKEYFNFSYDYIKKNSSSYASAMILRDHLKLAKIDTARIIDSYNQLSNEVKNSPDAEIIQILLNLH